MADFTTVDTRHFNALVCSFQANDPALEVDGIVGPKTRAAIDKYIADNGPKDLLEIAWQSALADVGKGGVPGINNGGAYVQSLRRFCGFPEELLGAWCAIFASKHLLAAGIPIKSRGAYRLCEKMANHPKGYEIDLEACEVGKVYLACWKRGRWETHREAHVRLIRRLPGAQGFERIGGNESGDRVNKGISDTRSIASRGLIMVVGWDS